MPKANTTTIIHGAVSSSISANRPERRATSNHRRIQSAPDSAPPRRKRRSSSPGDATPEPMVTVRPSRHRDVGTAWLVLIGLLLVATIPLAIELLRPAIYDPAEDRHVQTTAETWERNVAFTDPEHLLDPWTPIYEGQVQPERPPATTWLHVIAMRRTMENGVRPRHQALLWGRIIALTMTLVLIASVYWAGHSIGGLLTASMSGLVALSMPVLVYFGRIGSGDVHLATWVAISIAAGLWAMRPLRRSPALSRQFAGWLICGLAIGMATLTAGPIAVPPVLLPLTVMAIICPRRLSHTLGIVAALAVAVLVVTPWSIHLHESIPDTWKHWLATLQPEAVKGDWSGYGSAVGWRAYVSLAMLGFWALWLIPGLAQPFSTSTGEARRAMLLGWSWFVATALLMLLAPGPASVRPLLLLLAPAALLIGQVMRQYHDLSSEGRHARLWRVGRMLTIITTSILSLAIPALAYFETSLPDWATQWMGVEATLFNPMHVGYWGGMALALVLITILAARFSIANHPGRSLAAWAMWVVVLCTLLAVPLSRGELMQQPANPATLASE